MAQSSRNKEPLLNEEASSSITVDAIEEALLQTDPGDGLTSAEVQKRRAQFGPNALPEAKKNLILEFLKHFWGPMPIMIWIAILLEALNGIVFTTKYGIEVGKENWIDVGVLFGLQILNGMVGYYEERKASDAIAALKSSLAPRAHVRRNGKWAEIEATQVVPGDIVSLVLGGAIPADCRILNHTIAVDQAALTGESMPVKMKPGDMAKMGSSVSSGECEAVVVAIGAHTFFGKTAEMIVSVEEMGHVQYILWVVAVALTAISVIIVVILLIYLLMKGVEFFEALSVCVIILVASIPIAQEVVCNSTMAIGARHLANAESGGAIVSRLAAIEELAGMKVLCSDKTGTLTTGHMEMQPPVVLAHRKMDGQDVVRGAMLAAKWMEAPKDAIDRLILEHVKDADTAFLNTHTQTDYEPFDPTTKRTLSTVRNDTEGKTYQYVKGAPQIIINMCDESTADLPAASEKVAELAERGVRGLAVARSEGEEGASWELLGLLTFVDPPRLDTIEVIRQAQELGIELKMVTGDQEAIAKDTCHKLGLGTNVLKVNDINGGTNHPEFGKMCLNADGFAEVFPEHKFDIVESLRHIRPTVGMTGDGVNDAPALKRADCGIAVEGATDAARAAADIVLTTPGLSTIVTAIKLSRDIFQRLRNYVIYRLAASLQLVLFFFLAAVSINYFDGFENRDFQSHKYGGDPSHASWKIGEEYSGDANAVQYFMLPVFALVLITILNDGTIISIAYDNVEAETRPCEWKLTRVFTVAIVLGLVSCLSSLLLVWQGEHAPEGDSFLFNDWMGWKEGRQLSYYELQALVYLKISLSDFLTVFSARTQGPFFSRMPGLPLLGAAGFSMAISTLIAAYWPFGAGMEGMAHANSWDGWSDIGFVWIYCLGWWLIQDTLKVLTYELLDMWDKHCACLIGGKKAVEEMKTEAKARRMSVARRFLASPDAQYSALTQQENL